MKRWAELRKVIGGMLTVGSCWQIWECFNALLNGWDYAFPFKVLILGGGDIWIALDVWITLILAAYIMGSYASSSASRGLRLAKRSS